MNKLLAKMSGDKLSANPLTQAVSGAITLTATVDDNSDSAADSTLVTFSTASVTFTGSSIYLPLVLRDPNKRFRLNPVKPGESCKSWLG